MYPQDKCYGMPQGEINQVVKHFYPENKTTGTGIFRERMTYSNMSVKYLNAGCWNVAKAYMCNCKICLPIFSRHET